MAFIAFWKRALHMYLHVNEVLEKFKWQYTFSQDLTGLHFMLQNPDTL